MHFFSLTDSTIEQCVISTDSRWRGGTVSRQEDTTHSRRVFIRQPRHVCATNTSSTTRFLQYCQPAAQLTCIVLNVPTCFCPRPFPCFSHFSPSHHTSHILSSIHALETDNASSPHEPGSISGSPPFLITPDLRTSSLPHNPSSSPMQRAVTACTACSQPLCRLGFTSGQS